MSRGISGGQKRRLTTGEMLVGPERVLLMDEISNGLDSSTTLQIVKSLRNYVHLLNGTVLLSLLQPAPETYELFDDILLLSDGYIVYQGPRANILQFFEHMGFKCPERKGVAEFLQEQCSCLTMNFVLPLKSLRDTMLLCQLTNMDLKDPKQYFPVRPTLQQRISKLQAIWVFIMGLSYHLNQFLLLLRKSDILLISLRYSQLLCSNKFYL
ncbi:hypothetical protein ACHQM5_024106 [Ranunculus cassubicifolius]